MVHEVGTCLGGIRTLDELRHRCVVERGCDCWHFRLADGRPAPRGRVQKVWLHGVGSVPVTRAAWWLADLGDLYLSDGVSIARTCASYDCVNPAHLRRMSRRQMLAMQSRRGTARTPAKLAAIRELARKRAVVTPELLRWLLESPQSGAAAAHGLGITQGRANILRQRGLRVVAARSVFDLGAQMARLTADDRRAA